MFAGCGKHDVPNDPYFIDVAFADDELEETELKLIYDFGEKLGFPQPEIARALGIKIREDFKPLASALKGVIRDRYL